MKRTITHIFAAAALILASVSCWNEEMDDLAMGKDLKLRHQVSDLKAVPGDTEVQLSWTMEEGWNPTQYVITYTNPDQSAGKIETRDQSCLVTGLQNGYNYTFNVQAQYDDVFSGVQAVSAKPVTSRIAVKDLAAVAMDEAVVLSWTMPSTNVQGYKLMYYMEDTPSDVKTVTVGKDAVSYMLEGLENDKNYGISLVGVYAKGESDQASVKAMPRSAIAFFIDRRKRGFLRIRRRRRAAGRPPCHHRRR